MIQIQIPEKAKYIIETIQNAGFEAYVVGGCVRDSILGRCPEDWDITTSARPEQVKALFRRTIDTGIQHGTVTVMLDKEGFEVTTYRVDGKYEDSRHPREVTFTPNLEEELKQAKTLLYITDNCGEIVLDKIFIEELKKRYGNLEITVMVRGGLAINDATIEDAQEIGLTKIVPVISNGAAIAGTVKEQLSKEARKQLDSADVIIAKGMGNFESMYQEGINPYYLFLCKCDLFTRRFGVKLFDPIFCKEERLDIK